MNGVGGYGTLSGLKLTDASVEELAAVFSFCDPDFPWILVNKDLFESAVYTSETLFNVKIKHGI